MVVRCYAYVVAVCQKVFCSDYNLVRLSFFWLWENWVTFCKLQWFYKCGGLHLGNFSPCVEHSAPAGRRCMFVLCVCTCLHVRVGVVMCMHFLCRYHSDSYGRLVQPLSFRAGKPHLMSSLNVHSWKPTLLAAFLMLIEPPLILAIASLNLLWQLGPIWDFFL